MRLRLARVQAVFEHVDASPRISWKYDLRTERVFPFTWHFHDECELTLILVGRGSRLVADSIEQYEEGDLTLLGPTLPHTYVAEELPDGRPNQAVVIQFREDFLGTEAFQGTEFQPVGQLLRRARRGLVFPGEHPRLSATMREMEGLDGPECTLALLSVLVALARRTDARTLASHPYWPTIDASGRASIDTICRYLAEAHTRPVSLAELADLVHMAPTTFSRFFHRVMGKSVTAYVIEVRVASACRLLTETDEPVATIASRCGYSNLSNFNRQFRRLKGLTPLRYRKIFTEEEGRPRRSESEWQSGGWVDAQRGNR